jgi:hypothetical protein
MPDVARNSRAWWTHAATVSASSRQGITIESSGAVVVAVDGGAVVGVAVIVVAHGTGCDPLGTAARLGP